MCGGVAAPEGGDLRGTGLGQSTRRIDCVRVPPELPVMGAVFAWQCEAPLLPTVGKVANDQYTIRVVSDVKAIAQELGPSCRIGGGLCFESNSAFGPGAEVPRSEGISNLCELKVLSCRPKCGSTKPVNSSG
ncbi:unnamed protein product [Gemmata massiliana]|uniref:Uncharacterized protein n=1 Tax=Gemmata massiliana TaxID=1210884 RepID=A0A6P2CVQ0_9BACT|nr:unnamed protein product [Gemmata massiliana]